MEAALAKGRPVPNWYNDEPVLNQVEVLLLDAFHDLGTCRDFSGGYSPIPWTAICKYAEHWQLEPDLLQSFCRIIRSLDKAYLNEKAQEMERERNAGGKKG